MNYHEIAKEIEEYNDIILHFCKKQTAPNDSDYNNNYISLSKNISENVKKDLYKIIKEDFESNINKEVVPYNQIGAIDGTIEFCKNNDYPDAMNLINSFSEIHVGEIEADNFDFFVYELITKQNKHIYFIRRHNKLKSFRKGILGKFTNNIFDSIKSVDFIGIDNKIDFIIYDNTIFILYHTAFERVFNLAKGFYSHASRVLEKKELKKSIKNYDNLREDILNNLNHTKRVAKLSEDDSETSTLFLENLDKTKHVIDVFNLDIEIDNNMLVYDNKSQLGNFVNLMQDSYYRTLIGNEKGCDRRR